MKAFLTGLVLAVGIAVIVSLIAGSIDMSSAVNTTGSATRL